MTDNKYNGWTNYPTWRVNLEIFDGYDVIADIHNNEIEEVEADWCRDYAEEIVLGEIDDKSLAHSYAYAFLSDVNWHEIAESINEIQKQDSEEWEDDDDSSM